MFPKAPSLDWLGNVKGPWLGFDLGGTKMFAVVFDGGWKPVASERTHTKGYQGPDAGVKRMSGLVEKTCRSAGLKTRDLAGISVGCPGVVNWRKGVLVDAPNLSWRNVRIAKELEARTKTRVSILNDVDAGAFGEYCFGAGRGSSTLLGIFPGTGLGAACVIEGVLLLHRKYSVMELSSLQVTGAAITGEDNRTDVENVCSRLAMASAAAAEAYRGQAPSLLKHHGTDVRKIKSKALARSYRDGDPGVMRIWHNTIDYLALAGGAAIEMLGPDRLVIGGGLVEAFPEMIDMLREALKKTVSSCLLDDLKVRPAKLGDFACVAGAAAWAAGRKAHTQHG